MISVARVVHGVGALQLLPNLLDERGCRRVMLASCRSIIETTDLIDRLTALLGDRVAGLADPIGAHTPVSAVDSLEQLGRKIGADAIVAIGGSSVSDAAKVVSLRLAGGRPEVIARDGVSAPGGGSPSTKPPPTLIVVPTTLSAGEYNGGAGMTEGIGGAKIIVLDDRQLPWAVILDPEVSLATPFGLWASTGVKAVDHAAEAIWGARCHPFGDALAATALQLLARSLPRTMEAPNDLSARLDSQIGSWLSIASMKNTQLHLSHLIEHNMGSYWHLSHGITSCVALPTVMAFLADEEPAKVASVAHALGSNVEPGISDRQIGKQGAKWLAEWIKSLGLPVRLRDILKSKEGFSEVAIQTVNELQFFGYVPPKSELAIRSLLEQMW
jgi:maleylacetate reductase